MRVLTSGGKPVEGAGVSIGELGLSGSTGPDGIYRFGKVAPGTYTAAGQKDGYAPSSNPQMSVPASQTQSAPAGASTQYELQLDPLAKITVRVQSSDGTPVEGASVSVAGAGGSASGGTDASGNFDFGVFQANTYTVTGSKDGFVPAAATQTLAAPGGVTTLFVLTLDEEHGKVWNFLHDIGLAKTRADKVKIARSFFSHGDIIMDGQVVDPDTMTDQEVLDAFQRFNDEWRKGQVGKASSLPPPPVGGGAGGGSGGGTPSAKQNKINHIFGKPSHDLDVLVQKYGSPEAAYDALEAAAKQQVTATGVFEQVINVDGVSVTVRGSVINGVVNLGTAFR